MLVKSVEKKVCLSASLLGSHTQTETQEINAYRERMSAVVSLALLVKIVSAFFRREKRSLPQ